MRKTTQVQPKVTPPKPKTPKTQILDLECDNLADQVKPMRKNLTSHSCLCQLPVMMIPPPYEASNDQSFGTNGIHHIHTTGARFFGLETVLGVLEVHHHKWMDDDFAVAVTQGSLCSAYLFVCLLVCRCVDDQSCSGHSQRSGSAGSSQDSPQRPLLHQEAAATYTREPE